MTSKYVPVPKEDTYAMLQRAQQGDEEAKSLLAEQNTGLVKAVAMRFKNSEYEMEDLMQIGYIGLLKAIEKFNPDYDVMFSTYAVPMIMGELKRFFRDNGRIKASRSLKSDIYLLHQAEETLQTKGLAAPHINQLAETMGIIKERVLELIEASEHLLHIDSLDDYAHQHEYEWSKVIPSPEQRIDTMMIKDGIAALDDKERQVIVLRYFRDMTQQQIAQILRISQVQVSRIEKKSLEKMRKNIGETNL